MIWLLSIIARLLYDLLVTDFSSCGVVTRTGFISLRIWFPQVPGVVMMSDQVLFYDNTASL